MLGIETYQLKIIKKGFTPVREKASEESTSSE
jgi:hypothetical protein